MRTLDRSCGRTCRLWPRAALIAGLMLSIGAAAASARPVDSDLGWPEGLRKGLRLPKVKNQDCDKDPTRAMIRRQDRIYRLGNPRDELFRVFHRRGADNMWGSAWFELCRRGEMQIGVVYSGTPRQTRAAVRKARRYLARRKLRSDVRLIAVRSSYRDLLEASDDLWKLVKRLGIRGIGSGASTTTNTLEIDVGYRVPEADLVRLRRFAAESPVRVRLNIEPAPDPNAPIPTYEGRITLDRASIDRHAQTVAVTVEDTSCAADESYDSAARFAGVEVKQVGQAYVLTARLRTTPGWPQIATCEGDDDPRLRVATVVTLPEPLGDRGIVDGASGASDFRHVLLPPVGAAAIRSLVPKYIYSGETCDLPEVRQAFKGRKKTEWCFF